MVIKMNLFSWRSSKKKRTASITVRIGSTLIFLIFILHSIQVLSPIAGENKPPAHKGNHNEVNCVSFERNDGLADIVDPFNSTCYDWRGNIVPCDFKRQYAELLFDKPIPASRFIDNQDGTVTDSLTGFIWLKNANCFGLVNWEGAMLAAKSLKDGDCGPDPALLLSDGSSAGDWRLPTMGELCTLIDFSRRDPALPSGHMLSAIPTGYHWSATTLDYYSGMAWIVYFESGTTCYEGVTNQAGHILPVRKPLE